MVNINYIDGEKGVCKMDNSCTHGWKIAKVGDFALNYMILVKFCY
jgi:hypothetical protein